MKKVGLWGLTVLKTVEKRVAQTVLKMAAMTAERSAALTGVYLVERKVAGLAVR